MKEIKKVINKYNFNVNKYNKNGSVCFIDTSSGRFCLKKKKDDKVFDTISYLKSKRFKNFLDIVSSREDDFLLTRYIDNKIFIKEDKAYELIYLVSMLHNCTTFYKSISLDEVKCFYEEKTKEIVYLKNYYDNLCYMLDSDNFISPSKFLLLKNISLIFLSLDLASDYLNKWYEIMKTKSSKRMVLNHNNLDLSHILIEDISYLINWEHSSFDSPIVDLVCFFKRECLNVDVDILFDIYLSRYQLFIEEYYLLFVYLLIPEKVCFKDLEIENTKYIYELINYFSFCYKFVLKNASRCNEK